MTVLSSLLYGSYFATQTERLSKRDTYLFAVCDLAYAAVKEVTMPSQLGQTNWQFVGCRFGVGLTVALEDRVISIAKEK
jgi:hypothetical protein